MIITLRTYGEQLYDTCGAEPELGHHFGRIGPCVLERNHGGGHVSIRIGQLTKAKDRVGWKQGRY